jgi:hypothetical protein
MMGILQKYGFLIDEKGISWYTGYKYKERSLADKG